jgi:hypothetical protein
MAKFAYTTNMTNASSATITLYQDCVYNITITNTSKLDFVLNLLSGYGTLEYATIIPAGGVYEKGGVVAQSVPGQVVATCTNTLPIDGLIVIGTMVVYGYQD